MNLLTRSFRIIFLLLFAARLTTAQSAAPSARTNLSDDRGNRVAPVQRAPRLISLMPAITEAIFALGYGGRLAADSSFCNFPAAALALPKIGGPFDPNYERILALQPDRVLVMEIIPPAVLAKLDALKLPVVYLHEPKRLNEIIDFMRKIEAFSRSENELPQPDSPAIQEFSSRLHAAAFAGAPRERCLIVSPGQPLWTAGSGTFLDDFLRIAGCRNAAAGIQGWAALEPEKIATLKPGLILFIGNLPAANSPLAALLKKRKLKTLALDEDMLSRPSPRILVPLRQLESELGTIPITPAPRPAQAPAHSLPHAH